MLKLRAISSIKRIAIAYITDTSSPGILSSKVKLNGTYVAWTKIKRKIQISHEILNGFSGYNIHLYFNLARTLSNRNVSGAIFGILLDFP